MVDTFPQNSENPPWTYRKLHFRGRTISVKRLARSFVADKKKPTTLYNRIRLLRSKTMMKTIKTNIKYKLKSIIIIPPHFYLGENILSDRVYFIYQKKIYEDKSTPLSSTQRGITILRKFTIVHFPKRGGGLMQPSRNQ